MQLRRHRLPVLVVRHAEPAVCRVQHGYLQLSLLQQVSHHARQQALRLDVVPGLAAQEVVEVGLQLLKDGGMKPQKFMDTTVSGDRSRSSARSFRVPSGYSWTFRASRMERSLPSSTWHTPRDTVP